MPAVCAARWTVSRKPAVVPRTGRSPEVTPLDSARSCDQPDSAAAREPSQLSTWPDGKIITESNRVFGTCAKYPPLSALVPASGIAIRAATEWPLCRGGEPVHLPETASQIPDEYGRPADC